MIIFDPMNVIDIVLGIFLLLGFIRGFQKGLIIELAGIVALLLGIFGGLRYSYLAEPYLEKWTSWSSSSIEIVSFFIVFVGVLIAVSILAKLLTTIINSIALGFINRIFGAFFGVLKIGLFIFILFLILDYVNANGRFISATTLEASVILSSLREIGYTLLPSLQKLIEDNSLLNSSTHS